MLNDQFVSSPSADGAARIQRGWPLGASFVNEDETMPACLTRTQPVFSIVQVFKAGCSNICGFESTSNARVWGTGTKR